MRFFKSVWDGSRDVMNEIIHGFSSSYSPLALMFLEEIIKGSFSIFVLFLKIN